MHDSTPPTKTCTKCGRVLPREMFSRRANRPSGLQSRCRDCARVRAAAYNAAHREEERAYAAAYYAAHQEERLAYAATCSAAYSAAYRAAHPRECQARVAAWFAAHPDEKRAHNHNRRARQAAAPGAHTAADVAAQYLRQHGRCYWCGEKVKKAYHVDHVFPLINGGSNGPENIVIACSRCNLSKGAKMPHEFSDRLC